MHQVEQENPIDLRRDATAKWIVSCMVLMVISLTALTVDCDSLAAYLSGINTCIGFKIAQLLHEEVG